MNKRKNQPPDADETGKDAPSPADLIKIRRRKETVRRHVFYWVLALGVISLSAFDGTAHPPNNFPVVQLVLFIGISIAIIVMVIKKSGETLRELDKVSVTRTISRSLLSFTIALGMIAGILVINRGWVHIEACRTVGELETCQGPASPRQVLSMLAWHAANAVPALDIPHSLEWQRPARSANAVVGVGILLLRLWVAIGILLVLKRLWDKWGPGGSSREERRPAT